MGGVSDNIRDMITFFVSTKVLDVAVFSLGSSNAALFDPRCRVPASVAAACTRARLQTFLGCDHAFVTTVDLIDVVFWPKTHRVNFLGFEAATSLVTSYVAGDSTDLLGLKTLDDLASATIHMLGDKDLSLAMLLLLRTTDTHFWTMPAVVCDWFRALVTRYGWHVVLPPYLNLIERTDAMHMRLMASLVEDNKLCVRQRHAIVLLDAVLCLLLERHSSVSYIPSYGSLAPL
ncbi:hypothetical protein SDRG_02242 [Saprolegnia diclina VS20]|uniref:Uncharacterized protein n=1 Tax=Saprolegnia diclina (strain VS20) TaxID=1156394 RepID=T0R057_SAPDV|nr:hypothetical protein SDRG_02242 [Saprolegnia diclina VS20]EQC40341.1 hypothetical protein SDRG_02242 [Saprolegnia diclina VS20]|eukprot:XP_008606040.1 hypothetical protein SDRG_02242 [Saprolegnia diclina VS20]